MEPRCNRDGFAVLNPSSVLRFSRTMSSGVPAATISPPPSPLSAPRSMIRSLILVTSHSAA
jgi:hypothetical protein